MFTPSLRPFSVVRSFPKLGAVLQRCYRGFLDLDSAPADRTVARRVVVIQCLTRIWIARRRFLWQRRSTHAAVVIQRGYR